MSSSRIGRRTYAGGLACALALLAGLLLWRAERPAAPASETAPVAVSVATVSRRDVALFLSEVGNVQSLQSVTLRSQIDGVLTQVLVREGQRVQRGQVLALIDDRALTAAVEQARAARSRDEANLQIAQLDLKRDQNLLTGEAISRQSVDEQAALVEQLKATVQSDAAAIQAAEVQRSYTRIISPVTGRVGMRRVDAGNLVHASDTAGLFNVAQIDPISVVFSLPQQDLPRLQPLLSDPVRAQIVAYDRDAGTALATGHLTTFDNQIDQTTGTLQLRAEFSNAKGTLWPGQFVTVQLRTSIDPGATVVNARAVQEGLNGTYVFRVKGGVAEMTPVTVRYREGGIAAIAAGLRPGDVVVTDGQGQLTGGAAVKIIADGYAGASTDSGVEVAEQ